MFAFITDFFRARPKEETRQPLKVASRKGQSERTISYDPSLIETLKKDHSKLVALYGAMWKEGFEKRDYKKLSNVIAEFKASFQSHLLKENVKFYVYLEQSLADDLHTLQVVKDFRTDMNEIANAVIQFCKKYAHQAFTVEMEQEFERDYVKVGEVLTRRVSMEENELYVLYQAD
ncbi:MAG: hemerythrin domain-containing protein [Gammaproteobacteria bacterium]|nr:hemerythrin domain-containing protein [Gammaproteobacteria bacterium]NVK87264.1 hemerythrin domain-containing protein [Gammaproteobacteria bacterium]